MPFSITRSNSRERFNEVYMNLSYIESIEPKDEQPPHVKIFRGLYYVHLYSALEKVVNETIEQTITIIKNKEIKNKYYKTTFNVISLNAKMQGFKACGYKDYFLKSSEIFEAIAADDVFEISNTIFTNNLQNVWFKTIQETIRSFGAKPLEVDPRVSFTVDEVVDRRNAVAHGRETPISVGERFRCNVLRTKTQEIQLVADLFVATFEAYIQDSDFLIEEKKVLYNNV
jgi:hypothetical protein